MISNLIRSLDSFWEVEHRPKVDLSPVRDEMPLQLANRIVAAVVITVFLVAVVFVSGVVLV